MKIKKYLHVLLSLTATIAISAFTAPVHAHGAVDYPPARQVICKQVGGEWGSPENITDAGCRAAGIANIASLREVTSGWQSFWANVEDFNNQAEVEKEVPNGKLCSAGQSGLDSMNTLTPNWTKTPMQLHDGKLTVRFSTTVDHDPSFFKIYLSKPSYQRNRPLTWADLEQIGQDKYEVTGHHTNWDPALPPPPNFQPRPAGFHQFSIALPAGRTGDAILYTRWQRSSGSIEGFYNCSDITIEGGTPFPWFDKGGLTPYAVKVGDKIRFRVMDGTVKSGHEIVDESIDIHSANVAPTAWSRDIVAKLSSHSSIVQIGERTGQQIVFNQHDFAKNRIYVANTKHVPILDHISNGDPIPHPLQAKITGPLTVTSGQQVTFNSVGTTGGTPPYTYHWAAPQFPIQNPVAPAIQVTAPSVTHPTAAIVTLIVKDSKGKESLAEQNLTINPSAGGNCGDIPAWDAAKTYGTYGEKVSYNGKVYSQNFHNINKVPDANSADYGKEWHLGVPCPTGRKN
ncbi:MAG: lytic polysaccharide monooxygenase [Glaciimonas sp.]|nr:lytic polysaccharide monooxygenase [Glaciimonas sp.]